MGLIHFKFCANCKNLKIIDFREYLPDGELIVCGKLFDAFRFEADLLLYGNTFTEQADPHTCGAYEMGEDLVDVSRDVHGKVISRRADATMPSTVWLDTGMISEKGTTILNFYGDRTNDR